MARRAEIFKLLEKASQLWEAVGFRRAPSQLDPELRKHRPAGFNRRRERLQLPATPSLYVAL